MPFFKNNYYKTVNRMEHFGSLIANLKKRIFKKDIILGNL